MTKDFKIGDRVFMEGGMRGGDIVAIENTPHPYAPGKTKTKITVRYTEVKDLKFDPSEIHK